jgi:integrase
MSPQLEAVLRELQARRRRAGPWREPDGWVFTSRDWRHPLGETVFNRGWQRLRRHFAERRVRPLTLHSARHTWATLALRAGKSIRWIAEQLGHSDPAITLRIYAHLLPDEDEDLAFLDFDGSCSTSNSLTTGGRGGVVKLPAKSAD